jgi:hypothetical protein
VPFRATPQVENIAYEDQVSTPGLRMNGTAPPAPREMV